MRTKAIKEDVESIQLYAIIDVLDEYNSLRGPIYVSLDKDDIIKKFFNQEGLITTDKSYIAYMNLSKFGSKNSCYCDEYNMRNNWIELPCEKLPKEYRKIKKENNIPSDEEIKDSLRNSILSNGVEIEHFEDNRNFKLDEEPEIVYV